MQVLFAFLTYKGDYNKIKVLTENFLKDYLELTTLYEGMQAIPEEEQVMKRRQSALKKPDSTTVTEADKIVDMARGLEAKTEEISTAPKEVNATSITKMMPIVKEMMRRGKSIKDVKATDSSYDLEDQVMAKLGDLEKATAGLEKARREVEKARTDIIPLVQEMKNNQIAKSLKSKEDFEDGEVGGLLDKAIEMELLAKKGHLKKANSLFNEIFEDMKKKNFTSNQKTMQCDIYNKILKLHNEKHGYDEAVLWTMKTLAFLDVYTTTKLKIEICANATVAFVRKNEFKKAKILAETAVSMAEKEFGPNSSMHAEALLAFSKYLFATDQRPKSNDILTTALKIVESREGKESVAFARILSRISFNQYDSGNRDYAEATEQAQQALEILTSQLGGDNFLLLDPKINLAAIIESNARSEQSEEKKAELMNEVEKLERQIVETCRAVLGEFNPYTASKMGNLGLALQMIGKLEEAEALFQNAMKILVAIQGPEDNGVADIHSRLAVLYRRDLKDFKKAERHYLAAINIQLKLFGPAGSQLRFDYAGLYKLYKETGEEEKKKEYASKRDEWSELQEEKKNNDEKKEDAKEDKKMNFAEMVEFVKDN